MVAKKAAPADEALAVGKETVEKAVKMTQEVAQKGYEQAMALTKENVEKASKALFGNYDEMAEVGKAGYDAYMTAMNVWMKGAEAIGKELYSFTQGNVEKSVEASKTVLACKTLNELLDVQNDLAKQGYEGLVAELTKISELSVKTANDAFKPIQETASVAMEKLAKPIAA